MAENDDEVIIDAACMTFGYVLLTLNFSLYFKLQEILISFWIWTIPNDYRLLSLSNAMLLFGVKYLFLFI